MKRRNFVKGIMATAGSSMWLSGMPFNFKVNLAQAAAGKTLVVVFQRGGCDGLNEVVPYGDSHYYDLRPTIGIAPPDDSNPEAALDLNGYFGLHPAMAEMMPLWQNNHLAVMPAVHYPNGSRSHFTGQHYIESGQSVRESDGWLNRHIQSQMFDVPFRAVSFGNDLAQSLRGAESVSALTNLNAFSLGINSEEQSLLLSNLLQVYQQPAKQLTNHQLLNRFGRKMLGDLDIIAQVRDAGYTPAQNANYPSNGFANQLRETAQLIKAGVGLELATVSIGGWDTHANQGGGTTTGRQGRSLKTFADGLAAFYRDIQSHLDDVVVLTMTEFGRTSRENGSFGTDHGYASAWFAFGGGIQGGIYGDWPGLAADQLHNGRYLAMATDYRDIYAEILSNHLTNADINSVLPGFNASSLGLFNV
ncbi:hypothetical protein C2869_06020 [Saccharobesus litoralis]|uniref:DUF1501 domain-containing protein n=1 Tax=Saccharobesus litoralis TaxID=2172099 RepID=A0A2S0VP75_9ALTE|nr:DUF1501 domain-containing protein [Saccharobesus litoralis]AWB66021.1 hypothetical protein C2869_06020 [Saccharobesus litoralis]